MLSLRYSRRDHQRARPMPLDLHLPEWGSDDHPISIDGNGISKVVACRRIRGHQFDALSPTIVSAVIALKQVGGAGGKSGATITRSAHHHKVATDGNSGAKGIASR